MKKNKNLYLSKKNFIYSPIIKRLFYQKKYSRYKHLFAINIDDLTEKSIL
jgi:hypothetical protein